METKRISISSNRDNDSSVAQSDSFENYDNQQEIKLETMYEELDSVTIEDVNIKILTSRISKVIKEVLRRGIHAAGQLFEVAVKIVYRSSMFSGSSNPVVSVIIEGLGRMILFNEEIDEECQKSEKAVMQFISKLAVVCRVQKCEELLIELFRIIDTYIYYPGIQTRRRICQLMGLILNEANSASDNEQLQDDEISMFSDEDVQEVEDIIPSGIRDQWANKLSNCVLDRSPRVREAAVYALAQLDHTMTLKDVNGNTVTVNKLVSKSMSDVDPLVRSTAVRCVRFVGNSDIDKYMDFVDNCKENKIRQQMVIRLATDVHMLSFNEAQRFRLINILINSQSARMQDVMHQYLVESWMNMTSENISFLSLFHYHDSFEEIKKGDGLSTFPSIILEYLNPIDDPRATSMFLKFAITRYIRQTVSNQTNEIDFSRFLETLTEMSDYQCDIFGFLRRKTFRLVPEYENDDDDKELWIKKTYYRVFISRNFIDVIFSLTNNNTALSTRIRERALRLLVLGISTFSKHVESFCDEYFCDDELYKNHGENMEVLLGNVFHLFNVIIKENDDSFEKCIYKNLVQKLLENGKYNFSTEMVHYLTSIKLDLCEGDEEQIKEACDWLCYSANNILITSETGAPLGDDLVEVLENNWVSNRMLRRCTYMILAISQHGWVKSCSVLMSTLLKTLIPALLSNRVDEIAQDGIELIAYASIIDIQNCVRYLQLLRLLLESNKNNSHKSAAVNSLVSVINHYGFENVAGQLFQSENKTTDCTQLLSELLENVVYKMEDIWIVQVTRDIISLFSHGSYIWPDMMGFILRVVFNRKYKVYKLPLFFKKFCSMSVKTVEKKVHLLSAYLKSIDICEEMRESECDVAVMEMTMFLCNHLNTISFIENQQTEAEGTFLIEYRLCKRIVGKAIHEPLSWPLRHIFSALTTSLSFDFVPLKKMHELRNMIYDANEGIRVFGGKDAASAVKRFLTFCEKTIATKEQVAKFQSGDGKEIKIEILDNEPNHAIKRYRDTDEIQPREKKKKVKKGEWDDEEWVDESIQDDSFEYIPRASQRRKRKISYLEPENGGDGGDIENVEIILKNIDENINK